MRAPAWDGDHPLSAGEYYSSGTYHGSWDVAMPNYTTIRTPVDGEVLDYVTGVPNVPGGSGSPSNWILVGFSTKKRGKGMLLLPAFIQGARQEGQKVKAGDKIGESGNSGNSSGPHLHLTLQAGWKTAASRYDYLSNHGGIYPPDKGWKQWEEENMGLSADDKDWIKNQLNQSEEDIANKVWNHMIENTTNDEGKKYKAQWFLNSILKKVKP